MQRLHCSSQVDYVLDLFRFQLMFFACNLVESMNAYENTLDGFDFAFPANFLNRP